ncbi:exodeoxyribonuclease V subunit gamma [Methyloparacoccus murrellii]
MQPGFNLIFSNRLEVLSAWLLADLGDGSGDPLAAETVIVPGTAIRRRLEMDWARCHGVCANVAFGFLAQWVWELLRQATPVASQSPFAPDLLAWRLYGLFEDGALAAAHPRLARYLARADHDPLMRYELAQRVARLFDQYITYRQDWVRAWADGQTLPPMAQPMVLTEGQAEDLAWQADVWRRLLAGMGVAAEHPAEAFFRQLQAAGRGGLPVSLPPRVSLFALADVPPLYLDILARLSAWMTVNLYVVNPCREYWDLLATPRQMAQLRVSGQLDYHEVGNRLLAGWGRQTQAFLALLNDRQAMRRDDRELFVPAAGDSLLARLQNDILRAEEGPAAMSASGWTTGDRSLEVHVCHSLARELEVLHDQLLDAFTRQPDLTPADVLVVLPNLDEAAPLIEAVFGSVPRARSIPYTVTGLPRRLANPVAVGFGALLELLPSRCRASEVFAFLRRPEVRARFGLDEAELAAVHDWMRQAGMHWGLDGAHRARLGLPDAPEFTLGEGLDRLFLGYAVPGLDEPLQGRLPAGGIEGSIAQALGALDRFVEALAAAAASAGQPAPGEVWHRRLLGWLDDFFVDDRDRLDARAEVRRAILGLGDRLAETGVTGDLPLPVVQAALRENLEAAAPGAVPSGSVSFAGLGPMRHLPYRFVAALGLGDGVFPASRAPDEFDLIAAAPRLGGRQRRLDDRNVFLDLLLAARERLHLSYTGCSIRDNSALTPSILLAELGDYLERLTGATDRPWEIRHPLQAFSRRYFTADAVPGALFSHAVELAEALNQPPPVAAPVPAPSPADAPADEDADTGEEAGHAATDPPAGRFFPTPLGWRDDDPRELALADVQRFFGNPCRYLLERRLRLALPQADEELADDEPFLPDRASRIRLAERLLPQASAASPDTLMALARAALDYPPGVFGALLLEEEVTTIAGFAGRLRDSLTGPTLPPVTDTLTLTVDGETWRLSGALNALCPAGLVRARYDDLRPGDRLAGWIEHLFLNALRPSGVRPETRWIARDGGYRLPPCEDAREWLTVLLRLYRDGWTRPLHFYPRAAWAYVDRHASDPDQALAAARRVWEVNAQGYGESLQPAYRLALRGVEQPLDRDFEDTALAVLRPFRALALPEAADD